MVFVAHYKLSYVFELNLVNNVMKLATDFFNVNFTREHSEERHVVHTFCEYGQAVNHKSFNIRAENFNAFKVGNIF